MSNSLKDQLLGLGFSAPKPEPRPQKPKPHAAGRPAQPRHAPPRDARKDAPRKDHARKPPRTREDIDLAKAYAIRAQREKDERIEAERLKQEEARKRREAKAALAAFVAGKGLNAADAEHVRHFEYGGKIKRIHVTEAQLKALNAGELGVVQLDGRYLLVDVATLDEAAAIFPACVALRVDPDAPVEDDIPPDLVW